MSTICRAITFINYHIPLRAHEGGITPYCTIGYFDGLFSEKLNIEYETQDLKELWEYTIRKTAKSEGIYSYQNIFGFSCDDWNTYTDDEFWDYGSDSRYPLVFVVFLQLSDYMVGKYSIESQCKTFNRVLEENLQNEGMFYTYGTIDKNDFIVCIRSRNHKKVVDAIKKLHDTECNVVYSYSVLSIATKVLDEMSEDKYPYLYAQYVDSICLKGITNSFNPFKNVTLDQRYYEFCNDLIEKLYGKEEKDRSDEEKEYRIYDIMGDDDFRLIARHVNLGKLLKEFGGGGKLGYYQSDFRFYLYSSSLVLNTITEEKTYIDPYNKSRIITQMDLEMTAPKCEELSRQMRRIKAVIETKTEDEKAITFCQAVWQLLQSLKVLESAPTKKYDFYSLYFPFSVLVRILEKKMEQSELGDNDKIYEFIHKISMTLHGTLRTDIQFFQIRDFNVIVHYAPAKLRAFYAIWALKISEYYNAFEETEKKYSFILSPGMFGKTNVQQLFTGYDEVERLMLITIPERHMYIPQWLSVIIAHEVSHFVGTGIRNRKFRHEILLRVSARIATLEMQHFMYLPLPEKLQLPTEKMIKENDYLQKRLVEKLEKIDKEKCKNVNEFPYQYHSSETIKRIRHDYRYVGNYNIRTIVCEYGEMLYQYIINDQTVSSGSGSDKVQFCKYVLGACNDREDKLLVFFERFQQAILPTVLKAIKHLCTEAFADMIAILTLDFSPEKYVISFVKSEYFGHDQDENRKEIGLLPVRICLVAEAVKQCVVENEVWLQENNSEMPNVWGGDVLRETIFLLDNNSNEQDIMVSAFGYKSNLVNKSDSISNYTSMYNAEYDDETFSNHVFDFLNDKKIFDLLSDYLVKCAEAYMQRLEENKELSRRRQELLKTYQKISDGSVTDMMQEIENFLKKYES